MDQTVSGFHHGLLAFKPEFAWTFETGLKQTDANSRSYFNAAVFYTDYSDLQVQTFVAPGVIDVSNAAAATISGLEIEAGVALQRLQLSGSLVWLDAAYDSYQAVVPGSSAVDAAGYRLNNAPRWSGHASGEYSFDVGDAGQMFARTDVSWQSRVFFTAFNSSIESQTGYGRVHARVGFRPQRGRWELCGYIRNLANQQYVTGTNTAPPLPAYNGRPGEPRHAGIQLGFQY